MGLKMSYEGVSRSPIKLISNQPINVIESDPT